MRIGECWKKMRRCCLGICGVANSVFAIVSFSQVFVTTTLGCLIQASLRLSVSPLTNSFSRARSESKSQFCGIIQYL
jgi:hypothetical protein